jgi:hypothetical protein
MIIPSKIVTHFKKKFPFTVVHLDELKIISFKEYGKLPQSCTSILFLAVLR